MDIREISKAVTKIEREIESSEQNVTLGVLDPNLSKLHRDLKKIQSKCPHTGETYDIGTETFCDICHKKL